MRGECVFCKISEKIISSDVVFEDERMICIRDLSPKAPIHVLVIPKKHISTLNDLAEDDVAMVGGVFLTIKDIAKDLGIHKDGYRVVANCNKDGGQEVFHIHFHLLGGRSLNWPPG